MKEIYSYKDYSVLAMFIKLKFLKSINEHRHGEFEVQYIKRKFQQFRTSKYVMLHHYSEASLIRTPLIGIIHLYEHIFGYQL